MPQPKSNATSAAARRRTTAVKPKAAASKPAASKTGAAAKKPASRTAAAKKPAASAAKPAARAEAPAASKATASKTTAAKKPAAAKPKASEASAPAKSAAAATRPRARGEDPLAQMVGVLREQLSDASMLVEQLVRRGRGQTGDVADNLEALLSKGLEQLEQLSRKIEGGATKARRADSVDRLMRSADRARRAVGVGPSFPILAYDELSAAKVVARLTDLTPAGLRKVRDYERRHANRSSLLAAIDKRLG